MAPFVYGIGKISCAPIAGRLHDASPDSDMGVLCIAKNLFLRGLRIQKEVLYVKGDFITTCCIGMDFDSGRADMVTQMTSKSL